MADSNQSNGPKTVQHVTSLTDAEYRERKPDFAEAFAKYVVEQQKKGVMIPAELLAKFGLSELKKTDDNRSNIKEKGKERQTIDPAVLEGLGGSSRQMSPDLSAYRSTSDASSDDTNSENGQDVNFTVDDGGRAHFHAHSNPVHRSSDAVHYPKQGKLNVTSHQLPVVSNNNNLDAPPAMHQAYHQQAQQTFAGTRLGNVNNAIPSALHALHTPVIPSYGQVLGQQQMIPQQPIPQSNSPYSGQDFSYSGPSMIPSSYKMFPPNGVDMRSMHSNENNMQAPSVAHVGPPILQPASNAFLPNGVDIGPMQYHGHNMQAPPAVIMAPDNEGKVRGYYAIMFNTPDDFELRHNAREMQRVEDVTFPRHDQQALHQILEQIYHAFMNTVNCEDSDKVVEKFKDGSLSEDLVQETCWKILLKCRDAQETGRLVDKAHGTKFVEKETFITRVNSVMETLRRSKAACKQALAPSFLDRLADQPDEELKRKTNNKVLNKRKTEQNKAGVVALKRKRELAAQGAQGSDEAEADHDEEDVEPEQAVIMPANKRARR